MVIGSVQSSQSIWVAPGVAALGEGLGSGRFVHGVREGLRVRSVEKGLRPLYGPSHIRRMALVADREEAAVRTGRRFAVGPGDVVVSKFLPLRAAWVVPAAPRHPLDANCLRIVGLTPAAGFWVASLLNHPAFSAATVRRMKGKMVARIGLRELQDLRVPPVPPEAKGLAEGWQALEAERLGWLREVRALRAEGDDLIRLNGPSLPNPQRSRFFPAVYCDRSWLPVHVRLLTFQEQLRLQHWPRLQEWTAKAPRRLRGRAEKADRLLQLSHAEGEVGFRLPDPAPLAVPGFRVYAEPLEPGEVLLSLLGSSSKVVFNFPAPPETVWVSDHWVRFPGLKNPGALALTLLSEPVQWQLRHASTGLAQQFMTHEAVAQVRIPPLDTAIKARRHDRLCRALDGLATVRARQVVLHQETTRLIDLQLGGCREC